MFNPILHSERTKLYTILAFLSVIGLNIGKPKTINFSFETNGKLLVLGIPILKHILKNFLDRAKFFQHFYDFG